MEPLRTDGELREKLCADHALSVWKDGGECPAISCMVRRLSDGRRLYFVVNNSLEELGECRLSVSGDIALLELDCSRAEEREQPAEASMGRTVWTAAFAPAESHLWIEVPAGEREKRAVLPRQIRRLPLDGAFELKESTPNLLTLDACEYRIDAGEWQAEKALIPPPAGAAGAAAVLFAGAALPVPGGGRGGHWRSVPGNGDAGAVYAAA